MGKVTVITSGKGGVGKTTSTANLGTALAMIGKTVVMVDADIGLRNLDVVMGLESRVVYTSMDVIEKRCDLDKALVKDRRVENLMLLAASQRNRKDDIKPEQMQEVCEKLKQEFNKMEVNYHHHHDNNRMAFVFVYKNSSYALTRSFTTIHQLPRINEKNKIK